MAEPTLLDLELGKIRENPIALRTVNRESEEYLGLCDSIKVHGLLNPILVRPNTDKNTGMKFYELIDGLHRFSACKDLQLDTIPVHIMDKDEDQLLEAQIIANVHKVETKPVEYSKQLTRILIRNPLMTVTDLANKLAKSSTWVKDRLSVNKITAPEIQKLIDEGKIKLANAYSLAKLPPEEMANFVDRAITQQPKQFTEEVIARVKEIRDAKRKGKDPSKAKFQPVMFLRKIKEIKEELESRKVASELIKETNTSDPVKAFNLGVQWVMHYDPISRKAQEAEDDARRTKAEEAKKKLKAERETLKAEKAAEKAAEARDDLSDKEKAELAARLKEKKEKAKEAATKS